MCKVEQASIEKHLLSAIQSQVGVQAMSAFQSLQESDPGEIDAQLLTQELPPDAFIDQDFRAWLGKSRG